MLAVLWSWPDFRCVLAQLSFLFFAHRHRNFRENFAKVPDRANILHNLSHLHISHHTRPDPRCRYTDDLSEPIWFIGTAPHDAGVPPAEDTAQVGTPREQWENSLTAAQWYAYTGLE